MKPASLDGAVIALSASPPYDLSRLGYVRREFDGLIFELALQVIRQGGRILYGGHLQPGGTTSLIFEHLTAAYASGAAFRKPEGPRPVIRLQAATELRKVPLSRLCETLAAAQRFTEFRVVLAADRWLRAYVQHGDEGGTILCLGEPSKAPARILTQNELDTFAAEYASMSEPQALSQMRLASAELECARVVVGGKRGDLGAVDPTWPPHATDRFRGEMPGIFEEVIFSLPGVPVAILAAYGGAAREAAFEIGLLNEADPRVPYLGEEQKGVASARSLVRDVWQRLPAPRRTQQSQLAMFAHRDDGPTLARDLVRTLAAMLRPAQA